MRIYIFIYKKTKYRQNTYNKNPGSLRFRDLPFRIFYAL